MIIPPLPQSFSPLYVTQQETHHRVVSLQEEFRKLLDAHGIGQAVRVGLKRIVASLQASADKLIPETQAVGLGYDRAPLWGLKAPMPAKNRRGW